MSTRQRDQRDKIAKKQVCWNYLAAPNVVSHTRKEYSFLKPNMVHGDCDKKELTKFINEARICLNKTITEEERKEEGMIYASLQSGLD